MLKKLFIYPILLLFFIQLKAQESTNENLVRSTTGVSGSSVKITPSNNIYIVQQSIGQTSAIGTFSDANFVLRQGFIQPNVLSKIIDKNVPLILSATVYPNPFVKDISILYNEKVEGDITVSVYDMLGRLLFLKSYDDHKNINIILQELSAAHYILKVKTNNRQLITKIVKK